MNIYVPISQYNRCSVLLQVFGFPVDSIRLFGISVSKCMAQPFSLSPPDLILILGCFVRTHKSLLLIWFGQNMPGLFLRHLFRNKWGLLITFLSIFQVSQPYNRIDFTLELNFAVDGENPRMANLV